MSIKKIKYLLTVLLIISVSVNLFAWQKIETLNDSIKELKEQNQSQGLELIESDIVYKTFCSPKADFTFEYPSTWVYDEKEISTMYDEKEIKTMAWGFYPNLEGNYRNRPPYLAVVSPTLETVDFYSAGYKGTKHPYQLNIFPTNDPETYVTYEQGESGGKAYIYWQKGKAFASSYCIGDIYFKVNIMIFHSSDELEGKKVAQHIAKSIKIK